MTDPYIEWRKTQNIKPIILPNKNQYYIHLSNIEKSWSGRMDINICNTFIMEAEQLLLNAIELFELGYFDCAYYALRSSVEISTTMVFLTDLPSDDREKYFDNWKATKDFPMQGKMIKQLTEQGYVFSDMLRKMPQFFTDTKKLSAGLNKYVHKQGLQHFYVSRNHPINQQKLLDEFTKAFETYLQRCIGVVAVMRLAIDPFPVLLMDEEVLYRCFDSMTEPYSEEFVDKYIGRATIKQYEQTDIYIETYESLMKEEKKSEVVFDVMKYNYIDSKNIEKIFKQTHLLSSIDVICALLVAACDKTVKVYCFNGLKIYSTDRKTKRTITSWCTDDFKKFAETDDLINQCYDEAYISVLTFANENYFIEHNEKMDTDEIETIIKYVNTKLGELL